ncbi:cysteine desulfurase family protein [Granulicella cerasi]|uniref:cysteine desulfurase n=1 Tax=Granulicella cerasi TaxID=741063 RepID=A0ABW1Z7F1_9BACT|nr:cysteine desulfurase family protein [Granulicella cerasi]
MKAIYLDANATTPVAPEVLEAMLPYFAERSGNPSAAHAAGQRARSAVERAREQVARLLQATAKEIVFTSGGTESDNLALRGVLDPFLERNEPAHLVTTQIEHHAVLYAAEALEKRGVAVTYVAPKADGSVLAEDVAAAMRPETKLVSIMLANNETGVVQPVGKIARLAKERGVLVHTDAVQAAGKLSLDMSGEFKNVDLLSISGHKLYAPQGTGALFVRKGVQLAAVQHGGPQERQRRAGTENVPGIVALGKAAELAAVWLAGEGAAQLAALRDRLEQGIVATLSDVQINGVDARRVANTTNLRFGLMDAESLLIALDMQGIAASFGSACMSGATEPSHVLLAMGMEPKQARASLRFSLTRDAVDADVDEAVQRIVAVARRMSALG